MSQSTNIFKQLGPARKRLTDRLAEINALLEIKDVDKLRNIRVKFITNVEYHSRLLDALSSIVDAVDEEAVKIQNEIERCTNLDMDAREILAEVDNTLMSIDGKGDEMEKLKLEMEQEKLKQEIEMLKIETEVKKAQLEKIQRDKTPQVVQSVK